MVTQEKIISFIMEQLNVSKEECKPEATFSDNLGADSLDLIEMIMELEEQTGIEITDEEMEKMQTIGDVFSFLKSKGLLVELSKPNEEVTGSRGTR